MLEDIKRTVEAATKELSAEKAQRMARSLLEPGARKDQVAKLSQELMEWSQRNRERISSFVAREVKAQLHGMGLATRSELEALSRRVRTLEKGAAPTRKTTAAATKTRAASSKSSGRTGAGSTSTRRAPASKSREASTGGGRRRGASAS